MQRRWFVGLAVVLLLLTAGTAIPVSGANGANSGISPAQDTAQLSTPEGYNDTAFTVVVYENGSARWTITHSRILNESEREQFEAFASEFNNTETETYRDFKSRARALTSFGTDATNRQMNATQFAKAAVVDEQFRVYGRLQMSFMWTNFARTTDRGVVVDDVFEGGMYVGPDQRLVFVRGPNLTFSTVTPDPDVLAVENNLTASNYVEYRGEQSFDDERPKLVLVRPATLGGPTQSAATSDIGPLPLVVAIVLILGLGAGLAWYSGNLGELIRQRRDSKAGTTTPPEPEQPTEAEQEPAVPEEELLSDEDRVLKLLDENGGRMKQVNIVENTDWSKSKVSMLLSDMEEEGLISKLRVGRENIISKAGEEPDAVGSPFDDE